VVKFYQFTFYRNFSNDKLFLFGLSCSKIVKYYLCNMKFSRLIILGILIFLSSCRGEDESDLQKIDQVLNIYIKNAAGKDLLNTNIPGGFTAVRAQDLNADRALQEITGISVKKDQDTIAYVDYATGAVRILKDSISPSQKTYQSDFYINLSKIVNKETVTDVDTVKVEYNWSPNLFQVSKVWYNNKLSFSKVEGQPNIIHIVK
jgi:hypothetical protein